MDNIGTENQQKIEIYIFDDEEQQYINKIVENLKSEQITKSMILETLSFAREITDESNEEALTLIDRVYTKAAGMSEDEWDKLKRMLPFPVSITADDNTDEVPADVET